jgi:hypothetical protein
MDSAKRDTEPNYLAAASYFDHRASRARHEGDRERFLRAAAKYRALAGKTSETARTGQARGKSGTGSNPPSCER